MKNYRAILGFRNDRNKKKKKKSDLQISMGFIEVNIDYAIRKLDEFTIDKIRSKIFIF